ncbi:protein of unknown function [Methylocaldum szegediense]|uniref:Uncharacterized protein n=1 Tax=Methylocaldum szegediense TaxID=73780 RepID=A0ABM9I0M9_9GAMM|nr:protein of unknown function [Methylocaldum szegediense]
MEFGGNSEGEAYEQARRLMDVLRRDAAAPPTKLFDNPKEERLVWEVRESGLGATAHVPGH